MIYMYRARARDTRNIRPSTTLFFYLIDLQSITKNTVQIYDHHSTTDRPPFDHTTTNWRLHESLQRLLQYIHHIFLSFDRCHFDRNHLSTFHFSLNNGAVSSM